MGVRSGHFPVHAPPGSVQHGAACSRENGPSAQNHSQVNSSTAPETGNSVLVIRDPTSPHSIEVLSSVRLPTPLPLPGARTAEWRLSGGVDEDNGEGRRHSKLGCAPHQALWAPIGLSQKGVGRGAGKIAYFSRSLDQAEHNYCVTRKELLAVVMGICHFLTYLNGKRFLLTSDHALLIWLLNFKEPEGRLVRWLETLQDYVMEIRHRPGQLHSNTDALSRRPCMAEQSRHCQRKEEKKATVQTLAGP
ncbi:hypothetical protein ACEWY4_004214 [Coilia grayii]|uniref:Reverse transcriptase RNase H-like domain-containing protein n=1 Tax=Coilia grayii TaxID=363190 RepID=A0ABD1KKW1_9TELE